MWKYDRNSICDSATADSKRGKNEKKEEEEEEEEEEELECGPMPKMMVALPNTGGALCSMPQSLATRVPCSNAAKTRKPLKFAGVLQNRQQISAVSRPKFTL